MTRKVSGSKGTPHEKDNSSARGQGEIDIRQGNGFTEGGSAHPARSGRRPIGGVSPTALAPRKTRFGGHAGGLHGDARCERRLFAVRADLHARRTHASTPQNRSG